jgi:hypothetical protein
MNAYFPTHLGLFLHIYQVNSWLDSSHSPATLVIEKKRGNKLENTERTRMKGIELQQDLEFQKKEWSAERWGWAVGLLLLLAALAGVFGKGPLSEASRQEGPLLVEWERVTRYDSPTQMSVRVSPGQAGQETIAIWMERRYYEMLEVQSISPEPSSMRVEGDRLVVEFENKPAGEAFQATFHFHPQKAGLFQTRVGEENLSRTIQLEQVILP